MARTAVPCHTDRQFFGPVLVSYFPFALGDWIWELASVADTGAVFNLSMHSNHRVSE